LKKITEYVQALVRKKNGYLKLLYQLHMTFILQRYETLSFGNVQMVEKKDQFGGITPSGVWND